MTIPTTHPSTRTDLQAFLQEITGLPEDRVLFQPPENTKLSYPCVIYRLSDLDQVYADNKNYRNQHCYEIRLISKNPDSKHIETFNKLPKCRYLRGYSEGGLNYWVWRFWTNL